MTFDATCLEGFDRRMQFLAMAVAIVRRTGRDMELETTVRRSGNGQPHHGRPCVCDGRNA